MKVKSSARSGSNPTSTRRSGPPWRTRWRQKTTQRFCSIRNSHRREKERTMKGYQATLVLGLGFATFLPMVAREPLAARIAHSDPARYRSSPEVHGGAGTLDFTALFDAHTLEPNLQFLHRGVIQPKSGIGAHFHNQCEEMFVILDGEAKFTIDGGTSL